MFDANAANQPEREPERTTERSDPYKGLRSSTSLEELARAQGVKPIESTDDLAKWPEDDLDAWEGFDEFLEELRHGTGDLMHHTNANERRDAMSSIQPADRDDDTALDPKQEGDSPASGGNAGFWHSLTFEEIARAQGVQPVQRLEDIMGGWPDDERDDGFEEAIYAMRQEDLRREQSQ